MSNEKVLLERKGKIAYIVFNRPEKLNAFNREMFDGFEARLEELRHDDSVSVVILKGNGRAFSVGYDVGSDNPERKKLKSVTNDRDRLEANLQRWLKVWDYPKPVIAQIQGYALAGGTQLAVCCDIVVTSEEAVFGFPSLPLGGGYVGPLWTLAVGAQRSKLMDFTAGSKISGKEAAEWGFAAKSFPEEVIEAETLKIAQAIAKTPLDILTLKKKAINRVMNVQGFREAILFGAEWDAIIHQADGVKTTAEKIQELGLKGAIKWFNDQPV